MRAVATLVAGAALLAVPVAAQQPAPPQGHQGMNHRAMDHSRMGMQSMNREQMMMHGGPAGPENHRAMMRMQQAMMAVNERDPGRAWAAMMIPHHQGAVDTARITLRHTQDRELRRIAEETIRTQGQEITRLRGWLQRHGGRSNR